jgi:hypothetical protein
MNAKENLVRRIIIATGVLLAALWLPSTIFADHLKILTETCATSQIGFGETDPTDRLFQGVPANQRIPDLQLQREYAGFAETDPANWPVMDDVTYLRAVADRTQQVFGGFAEVDPAGAGFHSSKVIRFPFVMACL